jgi:hypothetical protein
MEGWPKIYLPLLAQQRTVAWMISTDHTGGIMECLERKHEDPDQSSIDFKRMSRVCKDCYAQGKEVYLLCRHLSYLAPYFQSPLKMEKLMEVYACLGALADFEKENMSLVTPDTSSYFDRARVAQAFKLTTTAEFPHCYPAPGEHIYIGIDPSGGGTSYAAFTSGWYSERYRRFFVSDATHT